MLAIEDAPEVFERVQIETPGSAAEEGVEGLGCLFACSVNKPRNDVVSNPEGSRAKPLDYRCAHLLTKATRSGVKSVPTCDTHPVFDA